MRLCLYEKLAQLVERQTVNLNVNGSSPLFLVTEALSCSTVRKGKEAQWRNYIEFISQLSIVEVGFIYIN